MPFGHRKRDSQIISWEIVIGLISIAGLVCGIIGIFYPKSGNNNESDNVQLDAFF